MTGLYAEASRPSTATAGVTVVAKASATTSAATNTKDIRKQKTLRRRHARSSHQQDNDDDDEIQQPPHAPQHASLPRERPLIPKGGVGSVRHRNSSPRVASSPKRFGRGSPPTRDLSSPSDLPFMFGGEMTDTGSVNTHNTGASQQELLRKKARSESKKRQHNRFGGGGGSGISNNNNNSSSNNNNNSSNNSSSSSNRKKNKFVVNMPASLVASGNQRLGKNGAAQFDYQKQPPHEPASFLRSHQNHQASATTSHNKSSEKSNHRWTLDEKESLTAESTVTDNSYNNHNNHHPSHMSNGGNQKSSSSSSHLKQFEHLPYSSMPSYNAVVKNEPHVLSVDEWIKEDERKEDDYCSIDEYSFPLLSNHALKAADDRDTSGSSMDDREQSILEQQQQQEEEKQQHQPQPQQVTRQQPLRTSGTGGRNSVRFSQRLEQSAFYIKDEDSEQFSDSQNADSSPSSILNHPNVVVPTGDAAQAPPKSILRNAKYTKHKPPQQQVQPIDSRHPVFLQAYLNNANAVLSANQVLNHMQEHGRDPTDQGDAALSAQGVLQPPPSFLDVAGSELSPIKQVNQSVDEEDLQLEAIQNKNGNVAGPHPSDMGFATDNESIASSRMAFIEAVAAVVIQTAYRRYVAMQYASYLKMMEAGIQEEYQSEPVENKSRAATREQQKVKLTESDQDTAYRAYNEAASLIQATFRGFWARDCLNVDHYCASAIQRIYRGYACRMNYQFDMYQIVTVQSVWRRSIARVHVSYVLAYTISIQAAIRGFLARRQTQSMQNQFAFARANVAATMIQSLWRMHYCWIRYNELLYALIIQSVVRGWLARRKTASIRAARAAAPKRAHRLLSKRPAKQGSYRSPSIGKKTLPVEQPQTKKPAPVPQMGNQSTSTASRNAYFSPNQQTRKTASVLPNTDTIANTNSWENRGLMPSSVKQRQGMSSNVRGRQNVFNGQSLDRAPFQESSALSRKLPPSQSHSPTVTSRKSVIAQPFSNEEDDGGSLQGSLGNSGNPSSKNGAVDDKIDNGTRFQQHNVPSRSTGQTSMLAQRFEQGGKILENEGKAGTVQSKLHLSALQKRLGRRSGSSEAFQGFPKQSQGDDASSRSSIASDSRGEVPLSKGVEVYKPKDAIARGSAQNALSHSMRANRSQDVVPESNQGDSSSTTSADWRPQRPSPKAIDTSGDSYHWAYQVWFERGLLPWKPT